MLKIKMKIGLVAFLVVVAASPALAASKSIKLTRHNLSNWSPYALYVKGNTTQVCIFCHAPHNADSAEAPLWNHTDTTSSFNIASSRFVKPGNSANVAMDTSPKRTSKKCLSCHDGTVSIGAVVNAGNSGLTLNMGGDLDNGSRVDVDGKLKSTAPGYIGTNLSGGHVISFRYDAALVGYLNSGSAYGQTDRFLNLVAADANSMRDKLGYMQCHTCHDPHTDACNDTSKKVGNDPLWRFACDGTYGNGSVCIKCHNASYGYYTTPKYPF